MDQRVAEQLIKRLHELGFERDDSAGLVVLEDGDVAPIAIRHTSAGGRYRFSLGYADTPTLSAAIRMQRVSSLPLLVLGRRITTKTADSLRALEISFVDAAGNASFRMPGLYVDVRGRREAPIPAGKPTPSTDRNLFSRKRAQVTFALLCWPEILHAPLRDLSRAAGTSLGQTQSTIRLLEQEGYVDTHEGAVIRRDELLDAWVAAYPRGLGAPSDERRFVGEVSGFSSPPGLQAWISGESASPLIRRPQTLTVYVQDDVALFVRENRWRRDGDTNIIVRPKYWSNPNDETVAAGIHHAPPLLVYADLIAARDPRLEEVAAQMRREDDRLRPR